MSTSWSLAWWDAFSVPCTWRSIGIVFLKCQCLRVSELCCRNRILIVSLEDHNFLKFTMNVNVSGSQNNWCRDALSSNSHRCLRRITTSWSTAHQLSEQGSLQARILICLYDYDQPSTPSNLKLEAPASQWVIRTAHELDAGQGSWNRRLRHHGRRNS